MTKKIAEFNYKLINCLLNTNISVSKWNKDVSPLCELCNVSEDSEHLLFSCTITSYLWEKIGILLKFNVSWKLIVLGFYVIYQRKT